MAKTKKKLSLKDRMAKKKEELKKIGGGGGIIFLKPGTKRVRVLPTGDENDFVMEVTQFYLGGEIKGVFSPATFGKPCAIMEAYEELKKSDDPDDKELAKKFVPKKKYLMPVIVYKDTKGKELDTDNSGKLVQLTKGLYEDIIDLYLDEDDWGDMTDKKIGYDLKLVREGTTLTDTEYSAKPCKNSKIHPSYKKSDDIDLMAMVVNIIPTYEETQDYINKYLNLDDDDEQPTKKKKKRNKKKRNGDV